MLSDRSRHYNFRTGWSVAVLVRFSQIERESLLLSSPVSIVVHQLSGVGEIAEDLSMHTRPG